MRQMVENKQRERLAHNSDQLQLFQPNYVRFTWSDMHGVFRVFFSLCTVLATHHLMDAYRLAIESTSPFHILHNLISKQTFNSIPFFIYFLVFYSCLCMRFCGTPTGMSGPFGHMATEYGRHSVRDRLLCDCLFEIIVPRHTAIRNKRNDTEN